MEAPGVEVSMLRIVAKLGAILFCSVLGAVLVPGCVIRIGPGTETDEPGDIDTQDPPDEADQPDNSNMPTQEELDALAQADPQQVALGKAKLAFTAYNTMGLIATNSADPSQLDEEALAELIDYYAPLAWVEAEKWATTIDLTTLDAPPVYYAGECAEPPYDCEGRVACSFSKVCLLTSCGQSNECGPCPGIFDLSKIATVKWCGYTCVVGKEVVGLSIVFWSKFKLLRFQECFANGQQ
jgi:hypothetical protein